MRNTKRNNPASESDQAARPSYLGLQHGSESARRCTSAAALGSHAAWGGDRQGTQGGTLDAQVYLGITPCSDALSTFLDRSVVWGDQTVNLLVDTEALFTAAVTGDAVVIPFWTGRNGLEEGADRLCGCVQRMQSRWMDNDDYDTSPVQSRGQRSRAGKTCLSEQPLSGWPAVPPPV